MSKTKTQRLLSDAELEKVAARFRLLAEPMRLKILQAICGEPRTVSDIMAATGATQTNISKHLALLAMGGVVSRKKLGPFAYYSLDDPLTLELCQLVHGRAKSGER